MPIWQSGRTIGIVMQINAQKQDVIYLILLTIVIIGLPFGIQAYDRHLAPKKTGGDTKEFTLTGNAHKGWVLGEVMANDIISLWQENGPKVNP